MLKKIIMTALSVAAFTAIPASAANVNTVSIGGPITLNSNFEQQWCRERPQDCYCFTNRYGQRVCYIL